VGYPSYPQPPLNPEIERLKSWVSEYFPVYDTRVTPTSLLFLVHADPASLEFRFDRLRRELWEKLYVPQITYERGEYVLAVVRRPARSTWGVWVNLLLLVLTCLTTVLAGAIFWLAYRGGLTFAPSDFLNGAIYFALPLLTILGLHELAHFVVARRHHVEASLPFFLPVPPPFLLFGTFGAFISLREPIPSKKALLDIGVAGPLAGFAVAVPVTIGGFLLSAHAKALSVTNCGPVVLGQPFGNLDIGVSVIYVLLHLLVPGNFANLQPLALAGWVGLLITAINLLPAGQLDGGHVFRALFGPSAQYVSIVAVVLLVGVGFLFGYLGWIIFAFLIFFLGIRHPPPLNDLTPLDWKRKGIGTMALVILVTGFVLVPLAPATGNYTYLAQTSEKLPTNGTGMFDQVNVSFQNEGGASFGFLLSGRVTSAVGVPPNSTEAQPLTGPALQQFLANDSWTVLLPNGNTTSFAGTGNFTVPNGEYSAIGEGSQGTFRIQFADSRQATVVVQFALSTLCVSGTPSQTLPGIQID
jgi:membrane-associated protease RseP (regulator of RpoE activity)